MALFSTKGFALPVGRQLLLADDSITIQKIVALTFAEEGIQVIAVSDGAEALEKLKETAPDIVLADVFMPRLNGYQVCEHIKQSEHLKHIPVVLMVGSFEPFDEVEARRVGADDILSKPFQSIRTLMDKVGALLGREAASAETAEPGPDEAPETLEVSTAVDDTTATGIASESEAEAESNIADFQEAGTQELPPPEVVQPAEEPMTVQELEITTADTQRLSTEIRDRMETLGPEEVAVAEPVAEAKMMPNQSTEINRESLDDFDDALLDLERFEASAFDPDDDVILDIDFDAPPDVPAHAHSSSQTQGGVAVESRVEASAFTPAYTRVFKDAPPVETAVEESRIESVPEVAPAAASEEISPAQTVAAKLPSAEPLPSHGVQTGTLITLEQLAPEVVAAIAQRVVAQLSQKAIEEIAWEVVPQLSELMIKRRLEEQEAQKK